MSSHSQKYKNKIAFKNDKYDTSKKWTNLNKWTVSGVCSRCRDTINWKIKYKKYKTCSQPKTCVRCHQKTVTQSYCIVCTSCAERLHQCKKCGQQTDIVIPEMSAADQDRKAQDIKSKLKCLSERQRRAYKRAVERGEDPDLEQIAASYECDSGSGNDDDISADT